ncbi:MAG: hypothetical protein V7636_1997 [Actinomycetota bacterium]
MSLVRRRNRLAVAVATTAIGAIVLLAQSPFGADAQVFPSSTTTTESTTTTTALLPTTTTTAVAPTTTTTTSSTTTTGSSTTTTRPRTTTTKPGPTTTTFVPPAGVASTTVPPAPAAPLDASTGWLPFLVTLSLGGFAVAVGILTVQWVRSRPRRA